VTKVKVKYLNQEKKQVMAGSSEKALSLKTGVEALIKSAKTDVQ